MKIKRWLFLILFLIPSLCFGAAADYKVDNLGNIYSHTLGVKAGTGAFYTIFQGGTQSGTVTYTLPDSSSTGLLKNTAGIWSWVTDITGTSFTGSTTSMTSGSLFQSGVNISDMAPRVANTTLNISRLNPDTTTDGLFSQGFEVIVKSPATSKQFLQAISTNLYNYGNAGAVYASGFGVGIWNHSEAHGTGTTWSIATEIYDPVGNADIIGHEIIVGRTASSVKTSLGLQLIADGDQPLTKALTIEQMDDGVATATWAKGIYAEQSAIGVGASDSFIELKDYFRVKRDGSIVTGALLLPTAGTAYKLAAYTATNILTELAAIGATGQYLSGVTGAIPAWQTKNPIDVRDYGVVGSGDETTKIQAAITAAGSQTLSFPIGTFSHTGLTISDSITIIGAGWGFGGTILNYTGSGNGITISHTLGYLTPGVVIKNLMVTGTGTGIFLNASSTTLLEKIYFFQNSKYGLHLNGANAGGSSDSHTIFNCTFQNNTLSAIYGRTESTAQINAINILDSQISQNYSHGVDLWVNDLRIVGNIIQGNDGAGINLDARDMATGNASASMITIRNNYFEANKGGNIYSYNEYQESPLKIHYATHLDISGNLSSLMAATANPGITATMMFGGVLGSYKASIMNTNNWSSDTLKWVDFGSSWDSASVLRWQAYDGFLLNTYFSNMESLTIEHPAYYSGVGAPGTTPEFIGAHYLDTTNYVWYKSSGTASSADWKLITISGITTGVLPYKSAGKFIDSPISTTGTDITVSGTTTLIGGIDGDTSLNGHKITSLGTPTVATDAATKAYVDAIGSGLQVKVAVRAATTTVLPACTAAGSEVGKTLTADAVGVLTIDGVATALNDRILVKNQVAGDDNGIYLVTTEGTAGVAFILTRTTDADTSAEVLTGMYCFVTLGTVNGNSGWILITPATITLDTTSLTFTLFSQAVASATYSKTVTFTVPGTLATGLNAAPSIIVTRPCTIIKAYAHARTVPTGAGINIDINSSTCTSGSTCTSPSSILSATFSIDASDNYKTTTSFSSTVLVEHQRLDIDIDQVGSTVPGADLTVQVEMTCT